MSDCRVPMPVYKRPHPLAGSAVIAISVKPLFAERIFAGDKRFEFRRVLPKKPVGRVYIHVCGEDADRVQGFADVVAMGYLPKNELWEIAKDAAGMRREEFDAYFDGCSDAGYLELSDARRFSGMRLEEIGLKRPPQGIAYVKGAQVR